MPSSRFLLYRLHANGRGYVLLVKCRGLTRTYPPQSEPFQMVQGSSPETSPSSCCCHSTGQSIGGSRLHMTGDYRCVSPEARSGFLITPGTAVPQRPIAGRQRCGVFSVPSERVSKPQCRLLPLLLGLSDQLRRSEPFLHRSVTECQWRVMLPLLVHHLLDWERDRMSSLGLAPS